MKEQIHKILNTPFWLDSLDTLKYYSISHDENDGDTFQKIHLLITPDGDIRLRVSGSREFFRFRFPGQGGGNYPKVRNALLILAEAIRLESEGNSNADI